MVINIFIYGSIFILSYSWLIGKTSAWTGAGAPDAGFWPAMFNVLLIVAGFFVVIVFCYVAFAVFGGLVNAPFYENISRKVEIIVNGQLTQSSPAFLKDLALGIRVELQKIIFHLGFLALFFLLDLIPAAGNIISVACWILFSAFFNALDFLDYPMTRRTTKFREKLKLTYKGGLLNYGFGMMSFLMMLVPVVNVFMKPILVVAGTSLYFEKRASGAGLN